MRMMPRAAGVGGALRARYKKFPVVQKQIFLS